MAIQIIDGFKLSSAKPIDDRIVASGSNARTAISYKYEGLRVFDTYDGIPYVWLNNQWKRENESGLSIPINITPGYTETASHRTGQILKVFNANKLLTNSTIFEVEFLSTTGAITSKTVAINHIGAGSVDSGAKLHVNGIVKATNFSGNGANITNIDPININTTINKIQISQVGPGSAGYVLITNSAGTALEWVPAGSLSSGTVVSSVATSGGTSVNIHYLTLATDAVPQSQLLIYKSSGQAIGVIPANGQIVVKNTSSPGAPPYSFVGETNTGIYRSSSNQVSISIAGNQKFEVSSTYVRVPSGSGVASLGFRFGGTGTTFTLSNTGFYQGVASQGGFISTVANNDEILRVEGVGGSQGTGNVSIFGGGQMLRLYGRSDATTAGGTLITFYKTGGTNPASVTGLNFASATRAGYFGNDSGTTGDFVWKNETTNAYITLLSRTSPTLTHIQSYSNFFKVFADGNGQFSLQVETLSSSGLGINVAHTSEAARFLGRNQQNFVTFWDQVSGGRQSIIGHEGTRDLNIRIEDTTKEIIFKVGNETKVRVSNFGTKIGSNNRGGTSMRSVYHGWFFCTYNTGGAGITSQNLYGSGMSANGFTYVSGNATPFQSNANRPSGFIKISTPTFADVDKVIVQITPRYSGISDHMIFTPQINSVNEINIYFMTTDAFAGWSINSFAFNISIFEIYQ